MSMEEDDAEKSFEASQKRLDDLRREGRVPRSADLQAAVVYAGFLLAVLTVGPMAARDLGDVLTQLLDARQALAPSALWPLLWQGIVALLPLLVMPALAALLLLAATRSLLFTPGNLQPRLSRISPLAIAAQRFGRSGLFDFMRNTAKMMVVGAALGLYLWSQLDAIVASATLAPGGVVLLLFRLMTGFLWLVLALSLVIGGMDYLWQWFEHARQARMTRQQMIEEHKEAEGDPQAKSQRRQKGQELALNRMMQDVPTADVVIVNPTHYAVALKWDRAARRAPVCVAKGVDAVAARIRTQAQLAGVPIRHDPPTARALHAILDLGDEVRPEHYKAVAAAIRFAHGLRGKRGKGQPE